MVIFRNVCPTPDEDGQDENINIENQCFDEEPINVQRRNHETSNTRLETVGSRNNSSRCFSRRSDPTSRFSSAQLNNNTTERNASSVLVRRSASVGKSSSAHLNLDNTDERRLSTPSKKARNEVRASN